MEQINRNINKKMNGNISNNKEVTTRLKQKLVEQEAINTQRGDEIVKLKQKVGVLK